MTRDAFVRRAYLYKYAKRTHFSFYYYHEEGSTSRSGPDGGQHSGNTNYARTPYPAFIATRRVNYIIIGNTKMPETTLYGRV